MKYFHGRCNVILPLSLSCRPTWAILSPTPLSQSSRRHFMCVGASYPMKGTSKPEDLFEGPLLSELPYGLHGSLRGNSKTQQDHDSSDKLQGFISQQAHVCSSTVPQAHRGAGVLQRFPEAPLRRRKFFQESFGSGHQSLLFFVWRSGNRRPMWLLAQSFGFNMAPNPEA